MINSCCFEMNGYQSNAYLDIVALGYSYVLIKLVWLEKHIAMLDYHNKVIICLNDDNNSNIQLKGISRPISLR